MLVLAVNLVVPVVLSGTARAAAQPASGSIDAAQKAKQHYLKGEAYFKAHDYSAAMGEYQSGYEEKPDPVFIFNIAQCQRLLGHPGPALQSYRRYLREAPGGAGRPVAERQIAELERMTADDGAAVATTTAPGAGDDALAKAPPATATAGDAPPRPSPTSSSAGAPPALTARSLAAADAPPSLDATAPGLAVRSEPSGPQPIYRRWWFWVAAGALSVVAIVAVSAASSGGKPACDAGRLCR